jgi:DNA invertase Pin-like site-specific DNA recombinase
VERLTGKGICVTFVKENLTFEPPSATGADAHKTAYSTLMLQLLGAVGQLERALIKERQREGIAIAKAKKLFKGRTPALNEAEAAELRQMAFNGMPKVEIAKAFGISRASVHVYLNS